MVIEPGLTGVVGPNGCGKSNLLEALRWVMGENSSKSMRGGIMDDVIFAGTASRPARNLAEVTLSLDNKNRTAPAAFNDELQLEISRRIERNSGSAYRLNGKDVRAKDVQLLFADASTGAHSPSLVSQGRIGALISAKPRQRRAILEEAAGISGLHTRRKEAESKLRSAEHNIERLADIEGQLSDQIKNLKSQVGQAARYKKLSEQIRELRTSLFISQWQALTVKIEINGAKHGEYLTQIESMTITLGGFSKEAVILAAKIPALRTKDNDIAGQLQQITMEQNALNHEEQQLKARNERLAAQFLQISADEERQGSVIKDAAEKMQTLETERKQLQKAQSAEGKGEEGLSQNLAKNQKRTLDAEWKLEELALKQAEDRAARSNLEREMTETQKKLDFLLEQKNAITMRLEKLESNNLFGSALKVSEQNLRKAEEQTHQLHQKYSAAEENRQKLNLKEQEARKSYMEVQAELGKVTAGAAALKNVLASAHGAARQPLVDFIQIKEGYEAALGAAFGDELEYSIDEGEDIFWHQESSLDMKRDRKLPKGVEALADYVSFSDPLKDDFLKFKLSQIGVVKDAKTARSLMTELTIGQKLVTVAGGAWRWDGLCISPDAPSAAAVKLGQRNELKDLEKSKIIWQKRVRDAQNILEAQEKSVWQGNAHAREAREIWQKSEVNAAASRRELTEAEQQSTRHKSEENALKDRLTTMEEEVLEGAERAEKATKNYENQPEFIDLENDINQSRGLVERRRSALSQARLSYDLFHSEKSSRTARLKDIDAELEEWARRLGSINDHISELSVRKKQTAAEQKELENRPGKIIEQRRRLNGKTQEVQIKRTNAIKNLRDAEDDLHHKEEKLKKIEHLLGQAREEKARFEAKLSGLKEQQEILNIRIKDDLKSSPQELLKELKEEEGDAYKDYDEIHLKLEKAKYRREAMGQVNLAAESQLKEINEKFELSLNERKELQMAIGKLRGAIAELNYEGRNRMLKAFEEVNEHFRELFTKLFGGGEAHLQLTESNDPLDAGLEIMASPPGKKMQNLGLLSGGEQALTALSLIFAVFMTNPAPICVLDEVDAPLDDANVERFCDLLDEMNKRTTTRFLIVTHNAVTMSRMQRLFGVTMAEQGVSKLVSVDLESAEKLREFI
jgi:chromosome segregation protein